MNPTSKRLLLLLVTLSWSPLNASAASPPQKGYENAGLPQAQFLLEELRALVGRNFWVRKPEPGQSPKALFCDSQEAPAVTCATEKFSVLAAESFTVEDLIIGKPNAALSWLKLKFASGKTAYLSSEDFRDNRYNESRVSTELLGIEYAIANSGWIFDDYPPKILDRQRAQYAVRNDPKLAQEQRESDRVTRLKLLYIGMTAQAVLNSSWGRPNNISTTVIGRRRLERWDYGSGNLLYFEDDRLQRIEAFRR